MTRVVVVALGLAAGCGANRAAVDPASLPPNPFAMDYSLDFNCVASLAVEMRYLEGYALSDSEPKRSDYEHGPIPGGFNGACVAALRMASFDFQQMVGFAMVGRTDVVDAMRRSTLWRLGRAQWMCADAAVADHISTTMALMTMSSVSPSSDAEATATDDLCHVRIDANTPASPVSLDLLHRYQPLIETPSPN